MITIAALNRNKYEPTELQLSNLVKLAAAISQMEKAYIEYGGIEFVITSGLRSKEDQARISPGHPHSAHLDGLACDIADSDKKIWDFCIENLNVIVELGLYLEDKLYTPRHVHAQLRAPVSGKRVYIP